MVGVFFDHFEVAVGSMAVTATAAFRAAIQIRSPVSERRFLSVKVTAIDPLRLPLRKANHFGGYVESKTDVSFSGQMR